MKNLVVVGYEERSGISKKSNKPYDLQIVHTMHDFSLDSLDANSFGNRVESFVFSRDFSGLSVIPSVGDIITVSFNRQGYPDDIFIVTPAKEV